MILRQMLCICYKISSRCTAPALTVLHSFFDFFKKITFCQASADKILKNYLINKNSVYLIKKHSILLFLTTSNKYGIHKYVLCYFYKYCMYFLELNPRITGSFHFFNHTYLHFHTKYIYIYIQMLYFVISFFWVNSIFCDTIWFKLFDHKEIE